MAPYYIPQTVIELSLPAAPREADMMDAGLSVMELGVRMIDAQDFHARFLEQARFDARGVHMMQAPEWASKFLRRSESIPHAVLAKLGSNAFAKRRPDDTKAFLDYIARCYESRSTLDLRLVAGPVKNVQRYGAYQSADMAEYLTLIQLARVVKGIAAIYPHGVRVQLVPDDKRGGIANNWPATYSKLYIASLQRMVKELQFDAWIAVEEGQERLYDEYNVAEFIHAATMEVIGDTEFDAKLQRARHHARENLFSHTANDIPEQAIHDSAIRYLVAHKAEILSGMWSPVDALPLIYANHPGNYQLYTMGRGLTKLPWQVKLPFVALNPIASGTATLPVMQLSNAS